MASLKKGYFLIGTLMVSLGFNALVLCYLFVFGRLGNVLLRLDLAKVPLNRAEFQLKDEERFRMLPTTPAEIDFVGDSLIAAGPWAELFTEIHNRGIGADRTDSVLQRLDEIVESHPRKILFLLGSNDLSSAVPEAQIVRHYRAILERIQKDCPTTQITVFAVLPVNPAFPEPPIYSNKEVHSLNTALSKLIAEFPQTRFVDLSPQLADKNGELQAGYSVDGLHLNLKGYLAIKNEIQALLN